MTELMSARLVATAGLILPAADIAELVPEAKEEIKKPQRRKEMRRVGARSHLAGPRSRCVKLLRSSTRPVTLTPVPRLRARQCEVR